ncbi:MAG TPA: FeoA family protein [Burkholderiaceae bacterium]|nr:FeoA family protein [Burkholderiaceae bacterium]HQR71514.1 FeoA family protein [Burkholderiaceae bacterium]
MGVVAAVIALAKLPRGARASVADVTQNGLATSSLPARLRELGFLDGEAVQVVAGGFAGGPIAVRIGGSTFALRSAEADCVLVQRPPA